MVFLFKGWMRTAGGLEWALTYVGSFWLVTFVGYLRDAPLLADDENSEERALLASDI